MNFFCYWLVQYCSSILNHRQAIARAHRIGQTKPVIVYRLVSERTVEERIVEIASQKLKIEHLAINDVRGNKPKLSADDIQQVLKFGATALFASSDSGPAAGRVWDSNSVDALIEKSVAEGHAETARKFAAAAAGQDYGGGVSGIFAGLTRWTLDITDASLAAAEAEWRSRFEQLQQERLKEIQAKAERLGKGFRIRRTVVETTAAATKSVAGSAGADGAGSASDDDSTSSRDGEDDEAFSVKPGDDANDSSDADSFEQRPEAKMAPKAAQPSVPLEARTDTDGVLKWAFEKVRSQENLSYPSAAAACHVRFMDIAAWFDPENSRVLSIYNSRNVYKWVRSLATSVIASRIQEVCESSLFHSDNALLAAVAAAHAT